MSTLLKKTITVFPYVQMFLISSNVSIMVSVFVLLCGNIFPNALQQRLHTFITYCNAFYIYHPNNNK